MRPMKASVPPHGRQEPDNQTILRAGRGEDRGPACYNKATAADRWVVLQVVLPPLCFGYSRGGMNAIT